MGLISTNTESAGATCSSTTRGGAYESAGRNEFREIAFEEALGRVEEPLRELGATLETPYDAAYVRRKADALREAGIETLRILIEPEDRTV